MDVVQAVFIHFHLAVPGDVGGVVGNQRAVGVAHDGVYLQSLGSQVAGYLCLYGHRGLGVAHHRRGDVKWVAGEMQVTVGDEKFHVAEEAAAGVPTGVERLLRVGLHGDDVLLANAQQLAHIHLEAQIAVVGAAHALAVEIDVAHVHDALEVEQHQAVLPLCRRGEGLHVPSHTHLLEAAGAEAALEIARLVARVALLVGAGSHPRLLYLVVVGEVHSAPIGGDGAYVRRCGNGGEVAGVEQPAEIHVDGFAGGGHGTEREGQGGKGGGCSHDVIVLSVLLLNGGR